MRTKRGVVSLLLSVIMIVSLFAGCGQQPPITDDVQTTAPTETGKPDFVPAESDTDAPEASETDAPGEAELLYLGMADARREEIKNTVTDCAAGMTGTIYYISNNGDDKNDGKSPATAWATVAPLWTGVLKSGDAVLFERGGEWYLTPPEGYTSELGGIDFASIPGDPRNITVGAYGEGEKPLLRGDIAEANDSDFWELYSDENGVKIWKSTVKLMETTVIVFNEGESHAKEIMPWFRKDGKYINTDGTAFVLEEDLSDDLTFVRLPELTFENIETLLNNRRHAYFVTGYVYLRCDSGNPADVYEKIAIPQTSSAFALNIGCAAYDLDIRYFTMNGAGVTSRESETHGQIFSNLEVGWCGGFCQNFDEFILSDGTVAYQPSLSGCGIYIGANSDITVDGCYIYQCATRSTVSYMSGYEGMPQEVDVWENYRLSNNLFEHSGTAFHFTDGTAEWNGGAGAFANNFVFENNLVMFSGDGWVYDSLCKLLYVSHEYNYAAIANDAFMPNNDGIYIRDNIFFQSKSALLSICKNRADGTPVNAAPIFEGNTYVQLVSLPLLKQDMGAQIYFPSEEAVRDILGDETGTLVILGGE